MSRIVCMQLFVIVRDEADDIEVVNEIAELVRPGIHDDLVGLVAVGAVRLPSD